MDRTSLDDRPSGSGGGVTNPLTADLDVDGFCLVGNATNKDVCAVPGNDGSMGNFIVRDGVSGNELRTFRQSGLFRIETDGNVGGRAIQLGTNSTLGSIRFNLGGRSVDIQPVGPAYGIAANGGLNNNIDLGISPIQAFRTAWLGTSIRDSGGLNNLEIVTDATASGIYRKKIAERQTITFAQGKVLLNPNHFGDFIRNSVSCQYHLPKEVQDAPITSGSLVNGALYQITTYNAGDDFLNVGALNNVNGEFFIATGTTPTNWTNGSTLVRKGQDYPIDTEIEFSQEGGNTASIVADTDVTVDDILSTPNFLYAKIKKVASNRWHLIAHA